MENDKSSEYVSEDEFKKFIWMALNYMRMDEIAYCLTVPLLTVRGWEYGISPPPVNMRRRIMDKLLKSIDRPGC